MGFSIDQILPSLQSLGDLGYWIIALASALEAFFITGVVIPGTLIVDAGGILVQRGVLDFLDLVWFVVIGSVLGSEISYWTGRLAKSRLGAGSRFMKSRAHGRARELFARRGGLALVLGRFSGPVAGLVPLVAALAGIERRTFVIWNLAGSIPFALAHVAFGYAIGGALGQMGAGVARLAVLGGLLAVLIGLVWWLLFRLFRLLPLAASLAQAAWAAMADWPVVARWLAAHPRVRRRVAGRLDPTSFFGLPLTCLTVVFVYVLAVWMDVTLDYLLARPAHALDRNMAEFMHLFWSPAVLRAAAHVTALGDGRVVLTLLAAALVWLAAGRRWALASGLTVAVLGDVVTVTALKLIFARPRPELAYFVETSGSFPSGHAAISVAFYGTLAYVMARSGRLGQIPALMLAGIFGFLIGASRIVLIEHYLSDVLNGWLVGGLWLLVGVTIAEWRLSRSADGPAPGPMPGPMQGPAPAPSLWPNIGRHAAVSLLAGFGLWQVATYDQALAVKSQLQSVQVVAGPEAMLTDPGFVPWAETLSGEVAAPVNLVLAVGDESTLIQILQDDGWTLTDAPSGSQLVDLAIAVVRDQVPPTTMLFPQFWSGLPNDIGLQSAPSGARTSIIRIWRTRLVTANGQKVLVASIAPDDRIAETTPTPLAITRARDRLVGQLTSAGQGEISAATASDGAVSVILLP